jgi:hypothetical protein
MNKLNDGICCLRPENPSIEFALTVPEGAFEALIRGWCAWLAERGMNRLIILTSPASPGVDLIRALADEIEAFNHWSPGVPPPADAAQKGLYIDPIYF